MTSSRWRRAVAVACLVIGPVAVFVQFLVTPVPGGDASVAETLNALAAHRTAMQWALALDLPLLLVIPALFYAGLLAGAATNRLAAIATALVVLPSIGAVVLIGQDALLYVASQQPARGAAIALVQDFVDNPLIEILTFGYLAIHAFAYPLLAVALRRARVLALWPAIGLGVWPLIEMGGYAAGARPVAAVGYFLQAVALGLCAAHLRGVARPVPAPRTQSAHAV